MRRFVRSFKARDQNFKSKKENLKNVFKLKNFLCFLFLGKYRASKIEMRPTQKQNN